MSRLGTVTWLALRELWISSRLVPLVVLPAVSGLLLQAIPLEATELGPVAAAGHWLAFGLAASFVLATGMAASTLAVERERGRLGWLVIRAVPRSGTVIGWFAAFSLLLLAGVTIGASAAWIMALSLVSSAPDPAPLITASMAVLAVGLASVAGGLLIGTLVPPRAAFVGALALGAAILGLGVAGPFPEGFPPVSGLAVLADLERGTTPVGHAVRGAGAGLVATAVLLLLASAVTERRDL